MTKTLNSLKKSYNNIQKSKNVSENIKIKVNEIFEREININKNENYDEIYNMFLEIPIENCPICNFPQTYGNPCPNKKVIGRYSDRRSYDEFNEYEKKHFDKWLEHRSKKIKCCDCSEKNNCNCINYEEINTILVGIGCLTKHNNTDIMKETTTKRNLYNWNNDEEYRKRIASNLGDKLGANLHDFSYNIYCNENCKYYKNCKNKDNKNLLKNKWGYCKEYENSWHRQYFVTIKFCEKCNCETPHKYNEETNEYECQVCSDEKIWCNHCNKWETVIYNSIPKHWIYWRSNVNNFIKENPEEVEFYENNIINFREVVNSIKEICGIYGWYINHKYIDINDNNKIKIIRKLVYVGKSTDIRTRCYEHLPNISKFPKWWGICDHNNDKLEIKILFECDKKDLDFYERKFINELHPWSQDIDYGAKRKSIISLNKREKLEWIN